MLTLEVDAEEARSGRLTEEHLSRAAQALRRDGFVVLANVVDPEHLETLRKRMLEDVRALLRRGDAPFNWNTGNVQQDPPPFHPYLFRDVMLNPLVVQVTRELLGPGVRNSLYSGNTALPSDHRQPVHVDQGHLWRGLEAPHPPYALVVNVPVVAVTPENGATEVWPGSHLDTTVSIHDDIKVPEAALERRRAAAAPLQPSIPLGGVLIRDVRLWHAGMPNRTQDPRPMIALIHTCSWWHGEPLIFPREAEAFFRGGEPRWNVAFTDEPIDHIRRPQAYEYSTAGDSG